MSIMLLIQSLPQSTATLTLIDCLNSESLDIGRFCTLRGLKYDVEITYRESDDGDWFFDTSGQARELAEYGASDPFDHEAYSD
jgi:hypothetical protein